MTNSKVPSGRSVGKKDQKLLTGVSDDQTAALEQKAYVLAMGGDASMLRYLLDRKLPKERCIKIALPPLNFANDAIDACAVVLKEVSEGRLSPREGADLCSMIVGWSKTVEVTELHNEVEAFKRKLQEPVAVHSEMLA